MTTSATVRYRLGPHGSTFTVVGLGLIGAGLVAWYAFGPDLQRYLKIRSM